jgi:hypothetical protein
MFRVKLVGSLVVVLCWASLAVSQEPPRLEAPGSDSDAPKANTQQQTPPPPETAPTPAKPPDSLNHPSSSAPAVRPMLVIPGVTAPPQRAGSRPPTATSSPPRSTGVPVVAPRRTSPSAAAPSGASSPFGGAAGRTVQSHPEPSARPSIPLSIEPLEDDKPTDRSRSRPVPPAGSAAGARTGSPRAGARSSAADTRTDTKTPAGDQRSRPRRAPGILGRLLGQPAAEPDRPESRSNASERKPDRDPRPGPETDAAVKRKIEKEIRDSLGDRVRSVEVRVSGRNVLVVAKATRFWQKRPVRRSLETLPILTGYRARIELED